MSSRVPWKYQKFFLEDDLSYNLVAKNLHILECSYCSFSACSRAAICSAYKWGAYEKGGATSTCMECAPLFLCGASLGIRTAAVLICATNYQQYSNDDSDYPRNWERRAIETGIEAMRSVIREDRVNAHSR